MALTNEILSYFSNGELADETTFNRPLAQLLANDDAIDERLVDIEQAIEDLYPGIPVAVAGGSADVITATFTPAITLSDMIIVRVVASAANATVAPTFSPNSLTAHTIVKNGGQALVAGDIPNSLAVMVLQYNLANTRWELLNPKTSSSVAINRINKTHADTPYTVTTLNCSGFNVFTNTGATSEVVMNLPAGVDGDRVFAIVTAAYDFTFVANGTETIRYLSTVSKAGGSIKSASVGDELQLDWNGTQWVAGVLGTSWQLETS